jgi:hypothetical protein
MGGSDQFFRVRTGTFLKAGSKRVLRIFQSTALGTELSFSFFNSAVPDGSGITFHLQIILAVKR